MIAWQPPGNPLSVPDDASWWDDRAYSYHAGRRLARASVLIAAARGERAQNASALFEEALHALRPCLRMRMMPLQWLNVFYRLGLCHAGLRVHSESKRWAEEALTLAGRLGEEAAHVDLFELHGAAARPTSDFAAAAHDFRSAFALLDLRPLSSRGADLAQRVRILAALSGYEFNLAEFAQARAHVEEGLSLADSRHRRDKAVLIWNSALLDRWTNHPEKAFAQAARAAELLEDLGNPCSLVRLNTVLADAALDLATRFPLGAEPRDRALDAAEDAISQARLLARKSYDLSGEALAMVTRARLTRLRDGDLHAAEADARFGLAMADNAGDLCLRAQSYTALGDLRIAQRDPEGARVAYLRARHAAAESVLPALDLWIDHGLRAVEEFSA